MVLVFVKFLVLSCHWIGEGYNIRNKLYEPYFGSASAIYGIMLPHLSKRKERRCCRGKAL
jgi:hypothetical protein